MDRNARHRLINIQKAVFDKAEELGIRQQLLGYSQMTPEQRRAVSPQVSRLSNALGHVNVKEFMLPPYSVFDTLGSQQAAAAVADYAPVRAVANYAPVRPSYNYYVDLHIRCRDYIAELEKVREELERSKEKNARLEKENAKLIELLPGRGGSRKCKSMHTYRRLKQK
jgi:hypothetical protein